MPEFKAVDLIAELGDIPSIAAIFTREPAMTRLEPQSISGDPAPGLEARVADPLWMIGRQWQFGELLGEDAGSPVSVRVGSRALPVTAWAPAGGPDAGDDARESPVAVPPAEQWRPWPQGAALEELVEHVPRSGYERGLRWRAETGAALVEALEDAGHGDVVAAVRDAYPLSLPDDPLDPDGRLDPAAARLLLGLGGAVPDGVAAADDATAGVPSWVADASDPGGTEAVLHEWLAWVLGAPDRGGAWTTPRLEHRFWLRFGHGPDAVVVRATALGSGTARWHDLEWVPRAHVDLDGDEELGGVAARDDVMLATPLRFPGMPADRYWQLEDGSIDMGAIEAQPHDLARLCLAEFALVSGDDWIVVPVDGLAGALNQVATVEVTTTFGETREVRSASDARRSGGFRIFEVTSADGRELDGVLLPPTGATPLLGDPVEEVAFVRDEAANMAWGIERIVPGRSGDGRLRQDEPRPARPDPPPDRDPEDVLYEFVAPVPKHWIPLVPVRLGPARIGLRKGAMLAEGEKVEAESVLLEPTPLTFPPEEIPREGITVRAVPALARRRDGTYARWTSHRVRVGRGEASSGFASDSARLPPAPEAPPPPP
jgi:hypothetical protein